MKLRDPVKEEEFAVDHVDSSVMSEEEDEEFAVDHVDISVMSEEEEGAVGGDEEMEPYNEVMERRDAEMETQEGDTNGEEQEMAVDDPEIRSRNSQQYKHLTNMLIRIMGTAYLPMSILSGGLFQHLTQQLNPAYRVPSERQFAAYMMSLAEQKRARLRRLLANVPADCRVCVTLDVWGFRRRRIYCAVTAHFVEPSPDGVTGLQLHGRLLSLKRLERRHAASAVVRTYEETLAEFGVISRLVLMVTESGTDLTEPLLLASADAEHSQSDSDDDQHDSDTEREFSEDEDAPEDRLHAECVDDLLREGGGAPVGCGQMPCAAHTLRLVVMDGLTEPEAAGAVQLLNNAVLFIISARRTRPAKQLLSGRGVNLPVSGKTRWTHQLAAVSGFLQLPADVLAELVQLVPHLAHSFPSDAQRALLEDVVQVLAPLAEAANMLHDETVTASLVIPAVIGAGLALRTMPSSATTAVASLRLQLVASLSSRFQEAINHPLLRTATMLDPRFKLVPWTATDPLQADAVRTSCLRWMAEQLENAAASRSAEAVADSASPQTPAEPAPPTSTPSTPSPPVSHPSVSTSPSSTPSASTSPSTPPASTPSATQSASTSPSTPPASTPSATQSASFPSASVPSEPFPSASFPPASFPSASAPPESFPSASAPPASFPSASAPPASLPSASAPPAPGGSAVPGLDGDRDGVDSTSGSLAWQSPAANTIDLESGAASSAVASPRHPATQLKQLLASTPSSVLSYVEEESASVLQTERPVLLREVPESVEEESASVLQTERPVLPREVPESLEEELSRYLAERRQPGRAAPLDFWTLRCGVYPRLAVLASSTLCVPAGAAPTERCFTINGRLFSPARNQLRNDLFEAFMHIKAYIGKGSGR